VAGCCECGDELSGSSFMKIGQLVKKFKCGDMDRHTQVIM
jgi:hypothetical protein